MCLPRKHKARYSHIAFHAKLSCSLKQHLDLLLSPSRGTVAIISLWDRFLCFWQGYTHISFLCERTKVASLQGFNFRSLFSPQTCSGYSSGQQINPWEIKCNEKLILVRAVATSRKLWRSRVKGEQSTGKTLKGKILCWTR